MPTMWGSYCCSLSPFYWHVERLTNLPKLTQWVYGGNEVWLRPTDMTLCSKPLSLWPPWMVHPESCLALCNLWTLIHQALCPWDSPGKNTGVCCSFLLQGILPTQGLNPFLLASPTLAGEFFTTSATWEAQLHLRGFLCKMSMKWSFWPWKVNPLIFFLKKVHFLTVWAISQPNSWWKLEWIRNEERLGDIFTEFHILHNTNTIIWIPVFFFFSAHLIFSLLRLPYSPREFVKCLSQYLMPCTAKTVTHLRLSWFLFTWKIMPKV